MTINKKWAFPLLQDSQKEILRNGNTHHYREPICQNGKIFPVHRDNYKIDNIIFISCVIWVGRTESSASQLPEKYGNFDSMRRKFSRWSKAGIFRNIFESNSGDCGDDNVVMIDSTFSNAARTADSLEADGLPREIGKSKDGFTTKTHMLASIEEKPLDFQLTGGQVNDSREGSKIIEANIGRMEVMFADKAYDINKIREILAKDDIEACIPSKSHRKNTIPL